MFEKVMHEDCINTLVQNILSLGHNFLTLFYGHPKPLVACFYQKIMQA